MAEPIALFATDLDGTLLGNPAATAAFNHVWNELPAKRRPILVYNTGRTAVDVQARIASGELVRPDYLISLVGTVIHDLAADRELTAWHDHHQEAWDCATASHCIREIIPRAEAQDETFQSPLKSSWNVETVSEEELDRLQEHLATNGLDAQLIYSNNQQLDIMPTTVGKGAALDWLCRELQVPLERVLVSGDRANDASLYLLPDVRGILVDNAQPELVTVTVPLKVWHAPGAHAEGLIQGLVHYGIFSSDAETAIDLAADDEGTLHLIDARTEDRDLDDEERAYLVEAYRHGVDALRRNITPLGFSAASLADNVVTGTDENYRSVWGRDGAITIIQAIQLDDEELRSCCRQTLVTLLDHTTAAGQVPANVRIDDRRPDYSGVGGICAIDSAMWVIIACYHYVQATDDEELLRRYRPHLEAIMIWLESHDSNLDGLLEIPEASDWTDLFGRSYNVLYDEVLWYRANVCLGLLCERLEIDERATHYLQRSQQIRGRLLHVFWPSTAAVDERLTTFADRQFSLGDARYLIAEVSPFNYSWRCDVFGNVLAYLFNVVDAPRAQKSLAFMWGCGVNEPWPVANLYPVVQAGDPDWRSYYTVNLLNLPNHYHNGGIWPLVGGMWVQYVHRLGQQRLARRELYRLARCCQQGEAFAWEFNEWYHGRTGRPMGKRFQAWSAATFVGACIELGLTGEEP